MIREMSAIEKWQKRAEMSKRKFSPEMRLLESFLLIMAGAFTLLALLNIQAGLEFGLLGFCTSLGLIAVGSVDLLLGMNKITMFERKLHEFRENRQGIVAIWIACFMGLVVYSIGWFVLAWSCFGIIDLMTTTFTYPAQALNTITLMRLVLTWHPIFYFIGMLLWAYAESMRRETGTEPLGYL